MLSGQDRLRRSERLQRHYAPDAEGGPRRRCAPTGCAALLLDLRGNPGGGLDVCVEIAGYFIGEGPVVYIQERGLPREVRNAPKGSKRFDLPLVVLVDNGQRQRLRDPLRRPPGLQGRHAARGDHLRQGLVQTVFPLRDGSALTLTTAKYLTAKVRDIDPRGVTPDVVVEQTKGEDPITRSATRTFRPRPRSSC